MKKIFLPNFTIKIANKPKSTTAPKITGAKISRKCLAAVIKDEHGEYKAVVNYERNKVQVDDKFTLKNEVLILPFTKSIFDFKGKRFVFMKNKDEYNHNICLIRDEFKSNAFPGNSNQYDVVKENVLICGYVVKQDGRMYFDYCDLVGFNYLSDSRIQDIKINDDKPLFNS